MKCQGQERSYQQDNMNMGQESPIVTSNLMRDAPSVEFQTIFASEIFENRYNLRLVIAGILVLNA